MPKVEIPTNFILNTLLTDRRIARFAAKDNANRQTEARVLATLLNEIERVGFNDDKRQTTDIEAIPIIKKFIKDLRSTIVKNKPNLLILEEISYVERYLPKQLTHDELKVIINKIITDGAGNIGAVMSVLRVNHNGTFDSRCAAQYIKKCVGC